MLDFNNKTDQRIITNCFKSFPEECKIILQATDSKKETIDLLSLFTLLKQWELMVPIALLKALFKRANRMTDEKPITTLSIAGFHQFMHNPNLQQIYRKHPSLKKIPQQQKGTIDDNYNRNIAFGQPGTLSQLFLRLYEMMSRKSIYAKLRDQKTFKEQYALIMKLFSYTKVDENVRKSQNEPSEIMREIEKSEIDDEWLDIFEDDEAPLINIVAMARRKGKSEAQAQITQIMDQDTLLFNDSQNKFKRMKETQTEQSTTLVSIFDKTGISNNLRKVHERMSSQLKLTSYDKNVQRVSSIIYKSGIEGRPLKLPQL